MDYFPVYKIDLQHELSGKSKGKKKAIQPSAIGIHPVTNDLYITDGPNARLLVMDSSGSIKQLHQLGKEFAKAEGITLVQREMYYFK